MEHVFLTLEPFHGSGRMESSHELSINIRSIIVILSMGVLERHTEIQQGNNVQYVFFYSFFRKNITLNKHSVLFMLIFSYSHTQLSENLESKISVLHI